MRNRKPSFTATAVSISRGIGIGGHPADPMARRLVPTPYRQLLSVYASLSGWPRSAISAVLRVVSCGLVDHMTLRTRTIDAAIVAAVPSQCTQIVVLGAGLDGRAWRMAGLGDVDLFEVDHPNTQGYKRHRVTGVEPLCRSLSFVTVDFEHERFGDKLAEAGHDAGRATFWIWEGVTMYLHPEVVSASIAELGRCSAPGSQVMTSYLVPGAVPFGDRGPFITALFGRFLGEALHGYISTADLHTEFADVGFGIESDDDSITWSRLAGTSPSLPRLFRGEHLCLAAKPRAE